jgi:hypothetical protein
MEERAGIIGGKMRANARLDAVVDGVIAQRVCCGWGNKYLACAVFAKLCDSAVFLIENIGRYNEESSECGCAVVVCHWGCGEGGGLFTERMDNAV